MNRLRQDVDRICPPNGRMVGSEGHRTAMEYLSGRLLELGLRPYNGPSFDLTYSAGGQEFHNLVGVVPCGDPEKPPVLIGAHYDSVIPAPCADDNAAAVAIALEAAAQLKGGRLDRDVAIALFDAEEPPHYLSETMGSVRFYKDQMHPEGVHAAVVMDLVGHDIQIPGEILPHGSLDKLPMLPGREMKVPYLGGLLFMTGAESHPALGRLVEKTSLPDRLLLMMTPNRNVGDMSDHHIFRKNGVPYLFLSCGRWLHYHAPTDTPDRLSYEKMSRVVTYLVGLVRAVAGTDLPQSGVLECDTVSQEIACLRKTFGMTLPLALRALGMETVETREDLDRLAERLVNIGL